MSTKGKFITLEGCDGCGKTTQQELLKAWFVKRGLPVLFTREPGGSPIAEAIRAMILDPKNDAMTDECEALLYAAARVQHLKEKVIPALERGVTVVCDRYIDSSCAYQGYGRGLGADSVRSINRYAIAPDLTVFFDLSPKEAFLRKKGADEGDRMETAGNAFFDRVYAGYIKLAQEEPERIAIVDARRSVEEIHADVVSLVEKLI
ncbi:MAG: dTMP kinase [Christensenellaceae bacterium]